MKNYHPSNQNPYQGNIIPMITPVTPGGELDEPGTCRVIDYLIEGGVDGIFVIGTTGEAASIPAAMKLRLVELTVKYTAKRAQVYAGISDTCLSDTIEAARVYFEKGIDVAVAHLPLSYPLTPLEQEAYYVALSQNINGPLMLYNMPITTHMSIPLEVVARLRTCANIVGLKDSENDAARLAKEINLFAGQPDFVVLIGVNSLLAQTLQQGADGIVPSLGNLVPGLYQRLYEYSQNGDSIKANTCQKQLNELSDLLRKGLSLGESLGAHKTAMSALNLCGPDMLPPILPLAESHQKRLKLSFTNWLATIERIKA